MTPTDTRVTTLPDGRDLAFIEFGDAGDRAVFAFHGTPGSRLAMVVDFDAPARAGVRLVVPDRPGYGLSSYHRGRRLADWATDVAFLADHLGIDRFAVAGVSGGGPHALACARFLADRVTVAGVVSGVGPIGEPGSEDDMMPLNRVMSRVSRRSTALLAPIMGAVTVAGRRWPGRMVETMARQAPAPDGAVLGRPEARQVLVDDLRGASRTAGRAAAQDLGLFARDWGFRLEDITVPVHFWQGDADRNVPAAHAARQAAAVPGAALHECPGEAHLLVVDHFDEILATLGAA